MQEISDLGKALVDVRKSFRLLWEYQKRVFDLVSTIADQFEDLSFYYWQINHSARPSNSGTNPLTGRWAWDMLPMLQPSFLFLPSGVERNRARQGEWMLEVHVNSDTGFEDLDNGSEPDPEQFEVAEQSDCTATLVLWLCKETAKVNWYSDVWDELDWPNNDCEVMDTSDPPFRLFKMTFSLTTLSCKEDVARSVNKFRAAAAEALTANFS